jgi:hypothetical protein
MEVARTRRRRGVLKAALVSSLVLVHFLTRLHSQAQLRPSDHHDFTQTYEYSLSLVGGLGLRQLALLGMSGQGAAGEVPLRILPADAPIRDFLDGHRDRLSREELDAYLAAVSPPGTLPRPGVENTFASSRVLDLYLAGWVWKLCGIEWFTLYAVYCGINAASCLCVFLIARRLAGSYWAGLAAAALYCASPLQNYLSSISLRDASPLWFACAGFYLLTCVADRCRTRWANLGSFLALGVIAMLGLGWRHDAALLPPVLGAGLLLVLVQRRRPFTYVLAALALFAGGAGLCRTGIDALCGFERLTSQIGYHMAFYGENTRCNLLGLENSFQIDWCDLQTYFEACRRRFVAAGEHRPCPDVYCEPHFRQCKQMYLEILRYNAFAWTLQFPRFYGMMLGGLREPGTVQGVEGGMVERLLPSWLHRVHFTLIRSLWSVVPWLFLLGALAVLTTGAQPMAGLCLLAFSALYAALLLLVLPMLKHLALVTLPLHVFAGVGVWAVGCLCRPRLWRPALGPFLRSRRLRWTLAGTAAVIALWGGTCAVAFVVSSSERTGYLRAVAALARHGVPAPETLKGKQLFSVRLPRTAALPGYLLTVRTGAKPGPLVCRHLHHWTQGAAWGKGYRTRHWLHPNRTQYFFVSCCQGQPYGDNRPYGCTVWVEGDAELVASLRVDLSHWDRLALSTVFTDDDRHPGSPPAPRPNSDWYFALVPVFASSGVAEDPAGLQSNVDRPLEHLLARDLVTGKLRLAVTDGTHFDVRTVTGWDPGRRWTEPLTGDFDGDGLMDVVGQELLGGGLWVARSDGAKLRAEGWGPGGPPEEWVELAVGDFDGDGLDDVVARNRRTGELAVARSTGKGFAMAAWGRWPTHVPWEHLRVGDFNGDGKSDLAGYDPRTGRWWVARSAGDHFETTCWGTWPAYVAWRHVCVGDIDGDGKSDLAGWDPQTGQWWVALSRGDHYECRPFGVTDPQDPWEDVAVGDIDGDGRDDLVGWSPRTGECWVARSLGDGFQAGAWGTLPASAEGLCVADVNGDGRADVAWRDPATGVLWVGLSGEGTFRFERWGVWPVTEQLTPLRAFRLWR